MTRKKLFIIMVAVFVSCLITSNTLAAKTFQLFPGVTLPSAVIIFPIVYICNDALAEVWGFKTTRKVVYIGFIMNLVAMIMQQLAILLPSPAFAVESGAAFKTVFGSSWRILLAGFVAYMAGSLLNAFVLTKLKEKLEKYLALRCIVSTLVGESVDALIFITISFIGTMPFLSLLVMIVAQAIFKTLYECVVYPLTRTFINWVKKLPEDDTAAVGGAIVG